MQKRMISIFCVITFLMTTMIYRIYQIDMTDYISMAATVQGTRELVLAEGRGTVYDRNMQPLVNTGERLVVSVLPSPAAATAILAVTPEEKREAVLEQLSSAQPFTMEVEDLNVYADGVDVFRIPVRYSDDFQIAPHVIGYLGGDGTGGASGIEKAYDDWLRSTGNRISVRYEVDAAGRALQGSDIEIRRENEAAAGGVVLSLDAQIQQIVLSALETGCNSGAAVVLDIHTGDIVAMASIPSFDQNNIAASLESDNAPFINRATSGYNIGSVFKLVIASAALESGISRYYPYECEGYIDIDGQIFRCNNHAVHGSLDMERALEVSCNTYFINLAQQMDPEYLLTVCNHLGLGRTAELAPGLYTASGNLPTAAELSNPAALANFSFGQGSSLASPLQLAQVVATITNGGISVTPRLTHGLTEDGRTLSEDFPVYATNQVLSNSTAQTVREMMASVIEDGSGRPGRPLVGGAGGKTSSAQTGQMIETENGEEHELVHAWFAGYFPADQPRYSVVVFAEGGESGERVAAPIFKQIADGVNLLYPGQ